ncbi:hypothetical protein [Sphaerisporangium corydalis]|uniref:Uncharacterized protein n=1 Tax=Sphaerisporangium corydalis TaxID=1441875 RepID=A0ABV9EM78_9ACTN|nr:hypothetical protein [Sphaerisporangium corydalis]
MTAVAVPPRAGRARLTPPGRLLRLELRRNPMPWTLPLLAVLYWFDTYQTIVSFPPYWLQRAMIMQTHAITDFEPFVVGVAAWMGSRDGRRGTTDLVGVTSRPRLSAQLVTWAATACWAVLAYLVFAGVLFAIMAREAVWGGPPWWLVAVGAASMVAFSAIGFTAGALLPNRFTPPLAVIAVAVPLLVAFRLAVQGDVVALIAPANDTIGHKPDADLGIFHPFLPDLSITQLIFLSGLTIAALAALGLPAGSGPWRVRRVCAALVVPGLVAAGIAVRLTSTARLQPQGMMAIPALHDSADDRPIGYTPVCDHSVVPICLHPAFRADLPDVVAALAPVLNQVTGLPGAPVRVDQITTNLRAWPSLGEEVSGSPPALRLPLAGYGVAPRNFGSAFIAGMVRSRAGMTIVSSVVGGGYSPGPMGEPRGTPAQQAIAAALLKLAGTSSTPQCARSGITTSCYVVPMPPPGTPIHTAAQRFAALPTATRHTWLTTHITALRTGRLSLNQLP